MQRIKCSSTKINLCDIPTTKGQWEQLTPDAKKKEGKKNPEMRATPKRAKIPRKRLRPRANVESKSPRKHLKQVRQRVDFISAWQQMWHLCGSYFTSCTSLKHGNKHGPPCYSPNALVITARSCQRDAGIHRSRNEIKLTKVSLSKTKTYLLVG